MNSVHPIWLNDILKVVCPHCQQMFELETGTVEWFKARRRHHLEALDAKMLEGNPSALKMGLEIDGIYQQKTFNVNLNAGLQINATVNAEVATMEAVRILGITFGITTQQYGKILKMLKDNTGPKKGPAEMLRKALENNPSPTSLIPVPDILNRGAGPDIVNRGPVPDIVNRGEDGYNGQEPQ